MGCIIAEIGTDALFMMHLGHGGTNRSDQAGGPLDNPAREYRLSTPRVWSNQSAAAAIGPEGVGLRTMKHNGISATLTQAER
jgi:hypothetical protein